MDIIIWVLIAVVVVILLYIGLTYNSFINLRNGIESTLNQINVALKKRLDMIAEIVDATKGIMKFEKGTLVDITKLRGQAGGSLNPTQLAKLATATNKLAGSIAIQVEAYPKLRSNDNVQQLVTAVQDAEQEIAQLRYTYNNIVQQFNTMRERVPSNIIAGLFGFAKTTYLQMKESAEELQKRADTKLDI